MDLKCHIIGLDTGGLAFLVSEQAIRMARAAAIFSRSFSILWEMDESNVIFDWPAFAAFSLVLISFQTHQHAGRPCEKYKVITAPWGLIIWTLLPQ
jgi:hypothetical protein